MKRIFITVIIVTLLVIACSSVNLSPQNFYSPSGRYGCPEDNKLPEYMCVEIQTDQEKISNTGIMPFTLKVINANNESDLFLSINTLESPEFLDNIRFSDQEVIRDDPLQIYWNFSMKADEILIFHGTIDFEDQKGHFKIIVFLGIPGHGPYSTHNLDIFFNDGFGEVIEEGTQIPYTPPTSIEITAISYTDTPGPGPTWEASATWYPEIATREALTQQSAKTAEPIQSEEPSP